MYFSEGVSCCPLPQVTCRRNSFLGPFHNGICSDLFLYKANESNAGYSGSRYSSRPAYAYQYPTLIR